MLCSRHNPSLLQLNGSGSHLYTANLHTLRSGHRELVLHRSRGLRFFPLPSLAFCTLIVSHFKGFVKRFFELFLFGREILFYFTQLRIGERLFAPVCLFCTLIVSQLGRFVKRFLKFLSKDFFYSVRPSPLASCGLLLTSLTLYHTSGGLSRGFLKFLLRKLRAGRLGRTQPLPTVRHLAWVSQLPRCSLPLTLIYYHIWTQITRWNIAQLWDL